MANVTPADVENITLNFTVPVELSMDIIAAVNIIFSITASLSNTLILVALRKVTSLHPPTKLLFQCLAITDLGVALTSQPLFANMLLNGFRTVEVIIVSNAILSIIFCGVSMLISTALSVDRLLALLLGLRYRHIVTLKRVRIAVACCWLTAFVSALVIFLFIGKTVTKIVMSSIILFVITISLFCYTKIVLKLRQHQTSVQENVHQGMANAGGVPINLEQYKRTVVSIALVQIALIACYSPSLIFLILVQLDGFRNNVFVTSTTFLYLNSSLNPFLYCWRIKEVRQAVLGTIKKFRSCPSWLTTSLVHIRKYLNIEIIWTLNKP